MPAPQTAKPKCDVPGCGRLAEFSTDGTEEDQNVTVKKGERKAIPFLNLDTRHANWAFSEDAKDWVVLHRAVYDERTSSGKGK